MLVKKFQTHIKQHVLLIFFLFDKELKLYYRGIFDTSRPTNETPITGSDLRSAYKSMLRADPVPEK